MQNIDMENFVLYHDIVQPSVAFGPDDLGQMGRILSKSLGYLDINKIIGISGLCKKWCNIRKCEC